MSLHSVDHRSQFLPVNKDPEPVLSIQNLGKTFGARRRWWGAKVAGIHAVQHISLDVLQGQTLGIVGESGCGKSTLARMVVGLLRPSSGLIKIEGRDVTDQTGDAKAFGRMVQYVFQDPISSLNPRKTIKQILEAPLKHLYGMDAPTRKLRIDDLLEHVNLSPSALQRYPHEFSGGQAQRIGIARALAAQPRILILDEPVSALDVSVQAQVLNLLDDLRLAMGLTYLFISHDLAVVEAVSDRVAVLYFGQVVEQGDAREIFNQPRHPYTQLLSASAPAVGRPLVRVDTRTTELPDPLNPPRGCAFAARCQYANQQCLDSKPTLESWNDGGSQVACFHPLHSHG